jgi:hypothetical protein
MSPRLMSEDPGFGMAEAKVSGAFMPFFTRGFAFPLAFALPAALGLVTA